MVNLPKLSRDKFYQAFLSLNFPGKGSKMREEGLGTRLKKFNEGTETGGLVNSTFVQAPGFGSLFRFSVAHRCGTQTA